ncbi:MAG: 4-phosphopantoate--beta-alanine ligase, partial [Candidatus Limnocylindrales bacterium]
QFGRGEDFGHYPRDEAADLSRLEALGVDLVFAPSTQEVYPAGFATTVDVGPLGERLEGAARPGHFRGVATVVTILFDLLGPGRAFFGQKDGQQTIVIRRLVRDLGLPVEVVVCPTIREPDGLAISSRNRFLSAEERAAAPVLSRALARVREAYERGEQNGDRLRELMRTTVAEEDLAALAYPSVAGERSWDELDSVGGAASPDGALVSLAVRLPSARLIDCLYLESG